MCFDRVAPPTERLCSGLRKAERLAQPVAQCLQLVECGFVDKQLAGAAARNFGRAEIRPAPGFLRHIAPMVVKGRRHGILQNEKTRHTGGSVGLTGWDGAQLGAAAEDLELDRDARQKRQHHPRGDHADCGLHRGAAHQPDAVEQ